MKASQIIRTAALVVRTNIQRSLSLSAGSVFASVSLSVCLLCERLFGSMSFFNGGGDAEPDDGMVDMSISFGEYGEDYDTSMDFNYPTDDGMLMSQESTNGSENSSGFFGAQKIFHFVFLNSTFKLTP
jgi:hypothetical protein